jgi:hypothetical protein
VDKSAGRPGPGARRVLDIEDAPRWAFRDELPKRAAGGALAAGSTVSPMFRYADLGGRIDDWSREPGFPAALARRISSAARDGP